MGRRLSERRQTLAAAEIRWVPRFAAGGQRVGEITKLKLVKRQMYGRAKIDLLQARLIGAT
jgi:transposase